MTQTIFSITQSGTLIITGFLSLLTLVTLMQYFSLRRKLRLFTEGSQGKNLEEIIMGLVSKVAKLEDELAHEKKQVHLLQEKSKTLARKPELLRYKALEGASSNQSFSLALLDSEGDGTVLTTLHVRDRVSFYGKSIKDWGGDTELTDEEKEVVERVKKGNK